MVEENIIIKDGYDFMNADFNIESLKVKSTIENNVSIKFINSEEDLRTILSHNLGCTKKIYQFFHTTPIELPFDIDTTNIEISKIQEMQQILK